MKLCLFSTILMKVWIHQIGTAKSCILGEPFVFIKDKISTRCIAENTLAAGDVLNYTLVVNTTGMITKDWDTIIHIQMRKVMDPYFTNIANCHLQMTDCHIKVPSLGCHCFAHEEDVYYFSWTTASTWDMTRSALRAMWESKCDGFNKISTHQFLPFFHEMHIETEHITLDGTEIPLNSTLAVYSFSHHVLQYCVLHLKSHVLSVAYKGGNGARTSQENCMDFLLDPQESDIGNYIFLSYAETTECMRKGRRKLQLIEKDPGPT